MEKVTKKNIIKEDDIINIAKNCTKFLDEKKAEDICLLDLRAVNSYLDYFIICTGNSRLHCRSLAKEVERFFGNTVIESRLKPDLDSEWIVLDYSEIIIHIFTNEMRDYYGLERLWADANKLI